MIIENAIKQIKDVEVFYSGVRTLAGQKQTCFLVKENSVFLRTCRLFATPQMIQIGNIDMNGIETITHQIQPIDQSTIDKVTDAVMDYWQLTYNIQLGKN